MSVELHQKTSLIFIPLPVMSHFVPIMEVAKLMADRDERLSIKVLIIKMPFDTKIGTCINNNHHPRIDFVHLPENESTSAELLKSPMDFLIPFIESQKGFVKTAVSEIVAEEEKEGSRCAGFVMDMVCVSMMDVATDEFHFPSYIFYVSGVATLGLILHLQTLHDDHNHDLSVYKVSSSSEAVISAPTYVNPFPTKLLPDMVRDQKEIFLDLMRRSRNAKGFIVNTFVELEPHPISSLSLDEKIPTVYPVGPLIVQKEISGDDDIIRWLNEQPDSSVVFLCFGSAWYLEVDQVKEIAVALERSGHRFVWALRKPPVMDDLGYPGEYEDPREVLPKGFLERTVATGRVIGWAPQVAVLSHRAVGGFVSQCGWNSILESVCCGVPMATWPLAIEQQANAFELVEEIGVGVEVKIDNRQSDGAIVGADVIERAIGRLMETGSEARVRVKVLKEKGRMALMEGESSYNSMGDLIADIIS